MIHNPELPPPENVLPHRWPMLCLSGVYRVEKSVSEDGKQKTFQVEGFWLPGKEQFEGHFPGRPVLPGVKMAESLAQLGGYAIMLDSPGSLGMLQEFGLRVHQLIRPEQRIEMTVTLTGDRRNFSGEGSGFVDDPDRQNPAFSANIGGILLSQGAADRILSA